MPYIDKTHILFYILYIILIQMYKENANIEEQSHIKVVAEHEKFTFLLLLIYWRKSILHCLGYVF